MNRFLSKLIGIVTLAGTVIMASYSHASPQIALPGPLSQPPAATGGQVPSLIPSLPSSATPQGMPTSLAVPAPPPSPGPVNLIDKTNEPVKEAPKPATDSDNAAPITPSGYTPPTWKGSLMFSAEELDKLQATIQKLANPHQVEVVDTTTGETVVQPMAAAPVATVFYLSSIIYVSPERWNIWLNNIRYSAGSLPPQAIPGLAIDYVATDKVYFTWTTTLLDKLVPGWEQKFVANKEGGFTARSNKNVKVSKDKTMISFMLYPYQHFSVADMAVYEGPSGY